MSLDIVTRDMTTLPTALLDTAKKHMRVNFTDDDALIQGYVAAAIEYFEVFSGLTIFDSEAGWTPDAAFDHWDAANQAVRCPIQPIREWVADDDGTDVTANYAITGATSGAIRGGGVYLTSTTGTSQSMIGAGITFAIIAGYDDASKIPPSILNLILRSAARLYEDRESTTEISMATVPDWMFELFAGNWIPRV